MQEAHRDGLDALGGQRPGRRFDAGAVERLVHRARRQHAFGDLPGEMPRHQRTMPMKEKIVGLRAVAAADNVDVAGAVGDDEAGLGAGALDQSIDGDGRAMDQFIDGACGQSALLQTIDNALDQIGRRREAFCVDETPGAVVKTNQIGKCAADIDGNGNHALISLPRGLPMNDGDARWAI